MYRTSFGIVRAVNQPLQTRVHQRAGAHGARLNCNKQLAVSQTMVTDDCAGFPQSDDLGMRTRVRVGEIAIPAPSDDIAIAHYDGAHRDFSGFERALRCPQSFFHDEFVGHSGCAAASIVTVGSAAVTLFVAQGHYRIETRSAACRDIAGK